MIYQPLKIETIEIGGLVASLKAMRLPKNSKGDSHLNFTYSGGKRFLKASNEAYLGPEDSKLAGNLIRAGDSHGKCMRGIDVWAKIEMMSGFMIEFVTYTLGVDDLSTSSTMHNELVNMYGDELANTKQDLMRDKVYTRIFKANYQALRRIYRERKSHRHPDWQIFCKWIEELPYFSELILAEKVK